MMHPFQIVSVFQESKENILLCQIASISPKFLFYPIPHNFFLEKEDKCPSEPFNSFPRSPECLRLIFCYYMEQGINAGPNNSWSSISGIASPSLLLRCSARCPSVYNVLPTCSRELQVSLHVNFPVFSSDTATLVSLHP